MFDLGELFSLVSEEIARQEEEKKEVDENINNPTISVKSVSMYKGFERIPSSPSTKVYINNDFLS